MSTGELSTLSDDEILRRMKRADAEALSSLNPYRNPITGEVVLRLPVSRPAKKDEFQWAKLTEPTHIRLLGLRAKRSSGDDGVLRPEWFLAHFDLHDCETYVALSYTWGGQPFTEPLLCDGRTIMVSKTVSTFLHDLYAPGYMKILRPDGSNHVFLWIDAICIDQNNVREKTAQVGLIGEIFSRAKRVLVWLGEATAEDMRALDFLGGLKQYFDDIYAKHAVEDVDAVIAMETYRENLPADDLVALSRLMGKPYFSRTWIVQEVALAQDLALQLGPHTLSFSYPLNMAIVRGIRQLYRQSSLSLHELLTRTLKFKSFDPRDKVFAVLGISDEKDNEDLQPDYSQRTAVIFHSFALSALRKGWLSFILASVTPRSEFEELPSWVPDWSRDDRNQYALGSQGFNAGGTTSPSAGISVDERKLAIAGTIIDKVDQMVETPNLTHARAEDWLSSANVGRVPELLREISAPIHRWIEQCASLVSSVLDKRKSGTSLTAGEAYASDVLWRILICNRDLYEREAPPEFAEYFECYRQNLSEAVDSPPGGGGGDTSARPRLANIYRGPLTAAMDRRVVASTTLLWLAVIPDASLPDDEIAVFRGLPTPYVLRPDHDSGAYRIIGEAYVHGVMDGEAIGSREPVLRDIVII